MVASPTPTVPIRSDSTSVISSWLPRRLARLYAASQPAVPPPAMTTRVLPEFTVPGFLSFQAVVHDVADATRVLFVHVGERALEVFRQVCPWHRVVTEDVVVEQRAPALSIYQWAVAQPEHRVHQHIHRITHVAGRVDPPVVHHDVEAVARLGLVPPEARVVQRIARRKVDDPGFIERLPEPREASEVRLPELRHRHDLATGRRVERARVQIPDLLRAEQREPPTPQHAADDVARHVVMSHG